MHCKEEKRSQKALVNTHLLSQLNKQKCFSSNCWESNGNHFNSSITIFSTGYFFFSRSSLRYCKTAGKNQTLNVSAEPIYACRIGGPDKPFQHSVLRFTPKENFWLTFCDDFLCCKSRENYTLLISLLHSLLWVTIWKWNVHIINFLLN